MIPLEIRREIAEKSAGGMGRGIPWRQILSKKKLTIGFMGGSVTQGFIADHVQEQAYPSMLKELLEARGYGVENAVCAEAGMNCLAGNLLADELILSRQPDIVFLEYAINETTLRPSVLAFESLVRKLLTQKNPPAVCFFMLRSAADYSCAGFMTEIAEHYGLPYADLRKGMNPVLEQNRMQWNDYADEESHPNLEGHRLLADCLLEMLLRLKEQEDSPKEQLPAPWLDAPYYDMRLLRPCAPCECVVTNSALIPNYHPYYPILWDVSRENGPLTITVRCRVLILFYLMHRLPEFGSCEILVDGKPMRNAVLHSNSIYGWGNENHVIAVNETASGEHTVTLNPLEENFFVLGFGICD
ncbi:MAG: SGNH/GDSL hydrolase family protein [Oscillospiraceae bacterium]|nr:SGNH/GDSL hydrolase family protein [Oscillospiraceae bacterium]